MSDPVETLARSAAQRLATTLDPRLPQMIELALAKRRGEAVDTSGQRQYGAETILPWATFVVTLCQLALQAYYIFKISGDEEELKRRLKQESDDKCPSPPGLSDRQREPIIDIIIDETKKYH